VSKEKGTPAQTGTGSPVPVIQKLHTTGERNVKIKLNLAAAKAVLKNKKSFMRDLRARIERKALRA
jgi:hypothetical protein